jgi:hypothetical protein
MARAVAGGAQTSRPRSRAPDASRRLQEQHFAPVCSTLTTRPPLHAEASVPRATHQTTELDDAAVRRVARPAPPSPGESGKSTSRRLSPSATNSATTTSSARKTHTQAWSMCCANRLSHRSAQRPALERRRVQARLVLHGAAGPRSRQRLTRQPALRPRPEASHARSRSRSTVGPPLRRRRIRAIRGVGVLRSPLSAGDPTHGVASLRCERRSRYLFERGQLATDPCEAQGRQRDRIT